MVPINKGQPPGWLRQLQRKAIGKTPDDAYNMLNQNQKDALRGVLRKEQRGLCVYCMCRLGESDTRIEHLFPRNPHPPVNKGQALDYGNLFLSCSGEKKTGNRSFVETCDRHKGNTVLRKVNPIVPGTLASICYKNNGEIDASDSDVKHDLVETLNLNCQKLVNARKGVLDELARQMESIPDSQRIDEYRNWLEHYERDGDDAAPYIGVKIWYLKKHLG